MRLVLVHVPHGDVRQMAPEGLELLVLDQFHEMAILGLACAPLDFVQNVARVLYLMRLLILDVAFYFLREGQEEQLIASFRHEMKLRRHD